MNHLEGMVDDELYEKLRIRWNLNNEPDVKRANYTAIIIDNQERHFLRLAEDLPESATGILEWRSELYDALKTQLRTHPLLDLCAVQPMTGPIGVLYWWQSGTGTIEATRTEADGTETKVMLPNVILDVADLGICAVVRKMKTRITDAYDDDSLRGLWENKSSMGMWVEEFLTEISREIVSTMLNSMTETSTDAVEDGADLKEELHKTSNRVAHQTRRAPANRIIANGDMLAELGAAAALGAGQIEDLGLLDEKWRVFCDPYFPQGKVLAWYQGEDSMDTGLIYSPYIMAYMSTTFFDPPKDMCVSRSVRIRHRISLVRPEFARLLQVGEHEKVLPA